MDNLILSLNVVLPLAIIMICGYIIKEKKVLSEKTISEMNSLCFRFFLPLLLFKNVYTTEKSNAINIKLISFALFASLFMFLISWVFVLFVEKENRNRGTMIQCIFRSNFVIFGMSVSESLFGQEGISTTSMIVGLIVPLFNVLAVICLEFFNGSKPDAKKIIKNITKNNLIRASVIAIILLYFGIKLPYPIEKSIFDISKIATPLSIMLLGASFNVSDSRKYIKQISIATLSRLIIVPIIMLSIGIYFGFRDAKLVCLMALFCSPTAVSSFTMSKEMNSNHDLASQIIVYTSMLSVVTVFFWILIMKNLNLI